MYIVVPKTARRVYKLLQAECQTCDELHFKFFTVLPLSFTRQRLRVSMNERDAFGTCQTRFSIPRSTRYVSRCNIFRLAAILNLNYYYYSIIKIRYTLKNVYKKYIIIIRVCIYHCIYIYIIYICACVYIFFSFSFRRLAVLKKFSKGNITEMD